jgi:serine/threonine protein kinase
LGSDTLDSACYQALEEHVEACPECQAALDRLAHRLPDSLVVLPAPGCLPRVPKFEIVCELSRSTMSVVYLAAENGTNRQVALKILPAGVGAAAASAARQRALREACALSRIRHPNVVSLYDYSESGGWFCLVLPYIRGGTLKQRLIHPLPARLAAGLVATIAGAVGFIHERGLLHLDLKPSNILLDCETNFTWQRATPKVSDFGLALGAWEARLSAPSLAGLRGTPSYMAPEQATTTRALVGTHTDIHALGAVLYELLTSRPPFQAATPRDTLEQVRRQRPVPPRRLNPRVPRGLEEIALKCLAKSPVMRYSSAATLAAELKRWIGVRPTAKSPVCSAQARQVHWS